MALKINTTLRKGIGATDCYARIIRVDYTERGFAEDVPGIRVIVGFYFDSDARSADERNYIEEREYVIEDTTKEVRADQYEYLKTLDDFVGAQDV